MACSGHCLGTSPIHQVQPSSAPRIAAVQSQRVSSSSCQVLEVGPAYLRSLPERKFIKCSSIRKARTRPSVTKKRLLVVGAAGQEAATSTLVVQEVDFAWKGQGSEVLLTGDFLDWEAKLPLEKGSDGIFHTKQKLSPGNYMYKFVVDGQWMHSPDSPTVPDGTGGFNNQIIVTDLAASKLDTTASKPSLEGVGSKDVVNAPRPSDAAATTKPEDKVSPTPKVAPSSKASAGKAAAGKAAGGKAATGKAAGGKAAKKVVEKSLPLLMSEDVIPVLKTDLEKEDDVSNVEILFEENQLQGSFSKNGVLYTFWAYFPDGNLEGSRGFSVSSHGSAPSTIEPFLIDEKKISAELLVFWITKRLFAQKFLSMN